MARVMCGRRRRAGLQAARLRAGIRAAIDRRWLRVTRLLRRLAFKRRQWAYLGHWLHEIKRCGRPLRDAERR